MAQRIPAQAFHPGEYLRDELLARDIDAETFSKQTGIPQDVIHNLCREEADFTVRISMHVGRALGTSAELWLNLQHAWDVWSAERGKLKAADHAQ